MLHPSRLRIALPQRVMSHVLPAVPLIALLVLVGPAASGCSSSDTGAARAGDELPPPPTRRPPRDAFPDAAQDTSRPDDVSGPSQDAQDGTSTNDPQVDPDTPPPRDGESDPCTPGDPSCDEGAPGCCTATLPCEDLCTADLLAVQRACTGCEQPGAPGVCEAQERHLCDGSPGSLCRSLRCADTFYFCTEIEGIWAWRPQPACDDGEPCTQNDRCQAGRCQGDAYTCPDQPCAEGRCEGNVYFEGGGTCSPTCDGRGACTPCSCDKLPVTCGASGDSGCCVASCDPLFGCITRVGTCSGSQDRCDDPNTLRLGDACQGCGAGDARGVCSGARDEVCDATSGGLCREVPCGGQVYRCTNDGGVWRWRTSTSCDDGDPCTHTDVCGGGTCRGTSLTCTSDTCNERVCNGTPTCAATPRVGAPCNDGNSCTVGTTCTASGTCGGGSPANTCGDGVCNCGESFDSCPQDCTVTLPSNACTNGSQSRDRCNNARTISRGAASSGWTSGEQSTCSGSNRFQNECGSIFDVGNDHVYALYMLAGERATLRVNTSTRRCQSGDNFSARLKLRFNADATAAGATQCPSFEGCYAVSTTTREYTRTYDATSDGWLFVIVDGGASAWNEHRGYYTLTTTLSRCTTPQCGC